MKEQNSTDKIIQNLDAAIILAHTYNHGHLFFFSQNGLNFTKSDFLRIARFDSDWRRNVLKDSTNRN